MVAEHPVVGPQPNASLSGLSDVLRVLAEGTSAATGDEFFRSLARHAATALGARYAFVAETLSPLESRSLAYWEGTKFGEGFSYRFPGTPCQRVAAGYVCSTATRLSRRAAARHPGEATAGLAGARVRAGRQQSNRAGRCADHRRDESRSHAGDPRGPLPLGPLLPLERRASRGSAAARAPNRHRLAGALLPRTARKKSRQTRARHRDRDARAARRLSLARQRARARKFDRARDRALQRSRARSRRAPAAPSAPSAGEPDR